MAYKQIVVIGNVGSGKSTLTQYLADSLGYYSVPADELYKTNPFFPLAVADRARWSLASDLWFLNERVKLMSEAEAKLESQHLIVDSGLLMSLAYTFSRLDHGFFTQAEWHLYQDYYQILASNLKVPDLVISLSAPLDYLRQRIIERGREFEIKAHNHEYLSGIGQGIDYVKTRLIKDGIRLIDYQVNNPEFDMEKVKEELSLMLE